MVPPKQMTSAFRDKHAEWSACLSGRDRNAIFNQLVDLVYRAIVYRVVLRARQLNYDAHRNELRINGLMHGLLDSCYVDSQVLAIRRLADSSYDISGKRGIYSLWALIDDLRKNVGLLTRQNLLEMDKIPFDILAVKQEYEQFIIEQARRVEPGKSYKVPGHLCYHQFELRHREIDRLCGVAPAARSLEDQVQPSVLNNLITKITESAATAKLVADKFIAHAATPGSREQRAADSTVLTLGDLWGIIEQLYTVANILDRSLLSRTTHTAVPLIPFGSFEYFDVALVSTEMTEVLEREWKAGEIEAQDWEKRGLDWILGG